MKRKFNYFHLISIFMLVFSLLLSVLIYSNSFVRIKETITDLISSIKCYYLGLFYLETDLSSSVVNVSSVDLRVLFPMDWETFKATFTLWGQALFNADNFNSYLYEFNDVILIGVMLLQLLLVIFIVAKIIIQNSIQTQNNDYGQDTKPLKIFLRIEKFFLPIKKWTLNFYQFFTTSKVPYLKIFIAIWLYNLNVFTILGETLAFLLYFVSTLDLSSVFIQIYKLFFDLVIMFNGLPWFLWLVIFIVLICKWRNKKGYKNLTHMNAKNCGLVKSLGVATLVSGPMDYGKTKLCVSMSLLKDDIFKETAKDTIFKSDFKFPRFPFVVFENKLKRLISEHRIYSLATAELYVQSVERLFTCYCAEKWRNKYKHLDGKKILFGYEYEEYGLTYNNGMYIETLFDVLSTYAKAYFVYSLPCSDKITNFAIREDGILESLDNFPLWDNDYFHLDPYKIEDISLYSKILDFDILRKGKKVVPLSELADTLEFGIVTITELDKERGNSLDTKELKKMVDDANQKNDLFNYSLKMGRHPSTIDFHPYIWFCFDLQRSMKVDADLREVCSEILDIVGTNKNDLALPLFFVEEFIYGLIIPEFKNMYELYRFYHGNNTLFMYLLRKICVPFYNYYHKTYNIFGYDTTYLNVLNGKLDNAGIEKKYYILHKKDFANRYSTDSHADFYRQSSLKKNKGIMDYKSYSSSRATLDELRLQNSYFIRDLENVMNSKDKE